MTLVYIQCVYLSNQLEIISIYFFFYFLLDLFKMKALFTIFINDKLWISISREYAIALQI